MAAFDPDETLINPDTGKIISYGLKVECQRTVYH
jgi:hypothetical protein